MKTALFSAATLFAGLALAACGGPETDPKAPEPAASAPAPATAAPTPGEGSSLTVEECTASGGIVVGDIGDGAIHRPDYKCPSGARPTGTIKAAAGGPISIEGDVCCPK